MILTISTACCRLTARASSRGAVPNTSPATAGLLRSGCFTQSTNAATPAWATSPSQDLFSADSARNHGSRESIEVIAAVPSALMDCSSRAMVSARTLLLARPGAWADDVAFALTCSGCHVRLIANSLTCSAVVQAGKFAAQCVKRSPAGGRPAAQRGNVSNDYHLPRAADRPGRQHQPPRRYATPARRRPRDPGGPRPGGGCCCACYGRAEGPCQ